MDFIATYAGEFGGLPHKETLNTSIELSDLRQGFGGCAMNIAVLLTRLGHNAIPFALIGSTFSEQYQRHLSELGIDKRGLIRSDQSNLSSHALIITDASNNQFTAFYPGPSRDPQYLDELKLMFEERESSFDFVVIAPDIARNVLAVQKLCEEYGLTSMCDPGQCITDYTPEEMKEMASTANTLCLNRYEYQILTSRTSWQYQNHQRLIVTDGKKGIQYRESRSWHRVPAAIPKTIVDPTGCGDAFRAGLVHAHVKGASLLEAVQSGATVASINIEQVGIQDYPLDSFADRYQYNWQSTPEWLGHG